MNNSTLGAIEQIELFIASTCDGGTSVLNLKLKIHVTTSTMLAA